MVLDGEAIGFIGQFIRKRKKSRCEKYVCFEFIYRRSINADARKITILAIPRFPSITRDIALVVIEEKTAGEIEASHYEAGGELLKEVHVFDLYEGEHMEEGKKSVAFSLNTSMP